MRVTRVAVAALAASLVWCGVALAEDNGRTEHYTLGPAEFWAVPTLDCGDFWVLNDWFETYVVVVRYDKDGNAIQSLLHMSVGGSVYYNEFKPDIKLEGVREHVLNRIRIDEDMVHGAGPGYRVVVPGQGVVLLQTGMWFFDMETGELQFGGPKQVFEQNAPLLCDALR